LTQVYGEGRLRVDSGSSIATPGMAGISATCPLSRVPAKVASLNQRPLGLGSWNWSSCPHLDHSDTSKN
jgi:hypothetical protein